LLFLELGFQKIYIACEVEKFNSGYLDSNYK